MIFNSAGHNTKGDVDPGAIGNGYREADLTAEFRNLVNAHLTTLGAKFVSDKDEERLSTYLARIQPGTGSVVHETHFNAGAPTATGVEVIIPDRHTVQEFNCAREIAGAIHELLGIPLRGDKGVKTESETHRGKLGLMREEGLNVLTEICFISNAEDLTKYFAAKDALAVRVAEILVKYDAMFT